MKEEARRALDLALVDVLKRLEERMLVKYDEFIPEWGGELPIVGNDQHCFDCDAHGHSVPEPHKPDCAGVRLLKDIRAMIALLEAS